MDAFGDRVFHLVPACATAGAIVSTRDDGSGSGEESAEGTRGTGPTFPTVSGIAVLA